jgi:uncharacterized protein (DUF952 family)
MKTWIYHITEKTVWEEAQAAGAYQADTLRTEGFIHCSTRTQVIPVANRFYHGRKGLVLLAIDPEKLNSALVWENLEGGKEAFPHIYGALNLDAVIKVAPFPSEHDGSFQFPENLI